MSPKEYSTAYYRAHREERAAYARAYRQNNKEKAAKYAHAYRQLNKEKIKERVRGKHRERLFNMTVSEYDRLSKEQNSQCAICLTPSKVLRADHNHTTRKARQLLCHNCNVALGLVKENTTTLRHMIDYLERHNGK